MHSTDRDRLCVSGWRLLDGLPHCAPILGQEVQIEKVCLAYVHHSRDCDEEIVAKVKIKYRVQIFCPEYVFLPTRNVL